MSMINQSSRSSQNFTYSSNPGPESVEISERFVLLIGSAHTHNIYTLHKYVGCRLAP